ncbi:MAG: hypothetical protein M1511_18525 [Deltaproteobacteria bacterium]|nr:hypothetical protein [Deltaproteobacteria bacterium]
MVLVTDHGKVSCLRKNVKKNLFRLIEVLVLVDQNVLERDAMRRGRVIS